MLERSRAGGIVACVGVARVGNWEQKGVVVPDVGIVGIVANPSSARDIRRLVANGAQVTTNTKINMVKRVLVGLGSVGVSRALSMTDLGGISATLADLANRPASKAWPTLDFVDQILTQSAADTTIAVEAMVAAGVGAIVVLGGDGTNGVVADACGDVPIASISTGTNNVFPRSAEPTVVGIAAGLVATGALEADEVACRTKSLTVRSGERRHRALVDVAITAHDSVASGAVWDSSMVREVFLCFAEPHRIGLSSIGAHVRTVRREDPFGLYLRLGRPAVATVRVPLGPGLMADVDLAEVTELPTGTTMRVATPFGVVAIDGERVFRFGSHDTVTVTLLADGPRAIDVEGAMERASARGLLTRITEPPSRRTQISNQSTTTQSGGHP
jgi:predicted polyphosphate/ATP-dependent NAD kinase